MAKDYRQGQKVLMTIEIEDKGQDFIELDVLENGVLLGDSVMFRDGRLSLLGIGSLTGMPYHSKEEVMQTRIGVLKLAGLFVYFKDTGAKDPLPWEANTFKYRVLKAKKPKDADRFTEPEICYVKGCKAKVKYATHSDKNGKVMKHARFTCEKHHYSI